jgi:hypothetical protein
MGCDIHIALEAQDKNGTWHCIWHDDLSSSSWYEELTKDIRQDRWEDPLKIDILDWRNYELFGFFSRVRGSNMLSQFLPGTKEGIFHAGIPQNVSLGASQDMAESGLHSAGHLTLAEMTAYKEKLEDIKKTKVMQLSSEQFEFIENFFEWYADLILVLNKLTGEAPTFGRVFGKVTYEKMEQDDDFMELETAHQSMSNASGEIWKTLVFKPETLRIIVQYDS